ncbi:MAG: hypothetical protein Q9224_007248, partial [Gallowayella concinna]
MPQRHEIVLTTPEDWDTWITLIEIMAVAYHIWDLIDPSISTKPESLAKPTAPDLVPSDPATGLRNRDALRNYEYEILKYQIDYADWKMQDE